MSYRVIYILNNPQIWSSYLKNSMSYAKPAKSVQNAQFLYNHFFERHFGEPGATPHITHRNFFLVKPVQNYI